MTESHQPRQHIAQIRYEKFGLDEHGNIVAKNPLAADLHHAVNHLSEGLYSKDTHFILELIQNAEDNRYATDVEPELQFHLLVDDPTGTPHSEGALLIVNNELGLRSTDVDALCSVGRSTKQKRQGYIGEKGIGFKSVFKVSPRPHLFSAGYQFYFDRNEDPKARFGYIIPYWVEQAPTALAPWREQTCLLLPLDHGQQSHIIDHLQRIVPETILFLNRLAKLIIQLPNQAPLHITVDRSQQPMVRLIDRRGVGLYWLQHYEAQRPADLVEEKRQGIDSRTISVAFPLDIPQRSAYSIFAYLPTEVNTDLPFLVNADFLLTSSRETIFIDKPWNQWLRDQIAPCFVTGFTQLIHHETYRFHAYRFIPLTHEIYDTFFQPIAEQIHQTLRQQPVVWVIGKAEPVTPNVARLAPQAFRDLLTDDRPLPAQIHRTPLIVPELQPLADRLSAIGVRDLSPHEVASCLRERAWIEGRPVEWFVALYAYLAENPSIPLKDLPIILTHDRRLIAVGAEKVYIPQTQAQQMVQTHASLLSGLAVSFLDDNLYQHILQQPKIVNWIRHIAQEWQVLDYCRDLIQAMAAQANALKPQQIVAVTRMIRDLSERIPEQEVQALGQRLLFVLDNDQITTLQEGEIITPAHLDPELGWQHVFPDPVDRQGLRILSDRYLADASEQERTRWQTFFRIVGLNDTPLPERSWKWHGLSNIPHEFHELLIDYYDNTLPNSTGGYSFRDFRPPQWLQQLARNSDAFPESIKRQRAKALIAWLTRARNKGFDKDACLEYFYYTKKTAQLDSQFYLLLCFECNWLPTTQGFHKAFHSFIKTQEIYDIFGDTVPYVTEEVDPQLAKWLGIQTSATMYNVKNFLWRLIKEPAATIKQDLVERIYDFILTRWRYHQHNHLDNLREKQCILVHKPTPRWVSPRECLWHNRADIFDTAFIYLSEHYPEHLRDFFVRYLDVPIDINADQAFNQLTKLAQQPAAQVSHERVTRIYRFLCEHQDQWLKLNGNRFREQPLIHVLHPEPSWVRTVDCMWADRAEVFGKLFVYLSTNYEASLRTFFVDHLKVKVDADDELYAQAWLRLQQDTTAKPEEIEAALELIFLPLQRIAKHTQPAPAWWQNFIKQAQVWSQTDRFIKPAKAFIPDDNELKRIVDKTDVQFVWRPQKSSFAEYEALYRALGVRRLTEAIDRRLAGETNAKPLPPGQERYLTAAFKRALCLYLWERYPDNFRRAKERGILTNIIRLQEIVVDQLKLHFLIDNIEIASAEFPLYIDPTNHRLYCTDPVADDDFHLDLAAQLALLLCGSRDYAAEVKNFIGTVLGKPEEAINKRIRREGWQFTPELEQWIEDEIRAYQSKETPIPPPVSDTGSDGAAKVAEEEKPVTVNPPVNDQSNQNTDEIPVERKEEAPVPPPVSATSSDGASDNDSQEVSKPTETTTVPEPGASSIGALTDGVRNRAQKETPINLPPPPPRKPRRIKRHRRRSVFVEPSPIDPAKRDSIAQAGIEAALEYERQHGREACDMGANHPGYDILSCEQSTIDKAQSYRIIEVKATEGEWSEWGVALTPNEWSHACQWSEDFYVYVVEYALDHKRRRLFVIRNPAAKVTEYRFGKQWRQVANEVWPSER